tara:strand:- start:9354 stop:10031 length:678 start_codon:yes stop_codon:yes gene_type:complete
MKNWVLYEDNHLIIVNKPSRIPVQGDKTGDETLLDIIKAYIKKKYNKPGDVYLGLPHRIDRPTSGIVILSKTSKSLSRMNAIFRDKKIIKKYWAVVKTPLSQKSGKLIHFLKKNKALNKSFSAKKEQIGFLKAELDYKLIKELSNYFLYEIVLLSGRHHQIRAQLSTMGSPIKGDVKYGFSKINKNNSIHLHAREIQFTHPVKNIPIKISAPPNHNDVIWENCMK